MYAYAHVFVDFSISYCVSYLETQYRRYTETYWCHEHYPANLLQLVVIAMNSVAYGVV